MPDTVLEMRVLEAMEEANTDWLLCNDLSHELGPVLDTDESLLILALCRNSSSSMEKPLSSTIVAYEKRAASQSDDTKIRVLFDAG